MSTVDYATTSVGTSTICLRSIKSINGIISVFFFLCVKVTKTCVLLSWDVAVQRSDVRPTLRDVMMMYSQDRYMKNLPSFEKHRVKHYAKLRSEVHYKVAMCRRT